jgi:hypothetical protein
VRGLAVVRGHLRASVHARIGATCHRQRDRSLRDRGERALQLSLDRAQPRLRGPAREIGPVVFEEEPGGQTSSRKTISLESERRGPSFRILV